MVGDLVERPKPTEEKQHRMSRLKRLTISVAVATAPAALIALGTGTAAGQPTPTPTPPSHVTRVQITNTNRNCDGSVAGQPSSSDFGFANINTTAPSGTRAPSGPNAPPVGLIAAVNLMNATPNATFGVRLIQLPPSLNDCGSFTGPYEGTLVTDASGNGSVDVKEPLLAGATGAFLAINNEADPGGNFYTSDIAPL
jgi:hypothetical protein